MYTPTALQRRALQWAQRCGIMIMMLDDGAGVANEKILGYTLLLERETY